ncbi:MAG: hypothetical protein Q8O03_04985 [Nanoarchaeota archaeon]|nr:hypothetical protein [Nanoarchaeota archaeon]
MLIRTLYNLHKLRQQEWMSKERLEKLRDKKLRILVQKVYNNNRFYRDFYKDYKKEIHNFKGFKDLQKLPVLEKEHVQKYSAEILGEKLDYSRLEKSWGGVLGKYIVRMTSGSSGQPVFVAYDSKAWDFAEAVYARSLFSSGYNAKDLLIVSYPYKSPNRRWFDYLGCMRRKYLQTNLDASEQLRLLLNERRKFSFFSFPSTLLVLAVETEKHKDQPQINSIISSGECLRKNARKKIEAAFGCNVYDHYGSAEVNRIAWECSMREGMHINIDSIAVEFVKNNVHATEGETGEILVTSLYNQAFPLIRYKLGDFGRLSKHKCSCGRGLPLMSKVTGRLFDFIVASDGRLIPPVVTDTLLNSIKGVSQFKLEQGRDKKLTLYIVKRECFEGDIKTDAMRQLAKLDAHVKAKVIITKRIEKGKGGKLNPVVSKCDKNF